MNNNQGKAVSCHEINNNNNYCHRREESRFYGVSSCGENDPSTRVRGVSEEVAVFCRCRLYIECSIVEKHFLVATIIHLPVCLTIGIVSITPIFFFFSWRRRTLCHHHNPSFFPPQYPLLRIMMYYKAIMNHLLFKTRLFSLSRIPRLPNCHGMATKASKHFLVNEALVQAIRRRARNTPPEHIQVRILNKSATAQLLSLPQAIQLSLKEKLDLIGISLQQDVPVLRLDQYKAFLYRHEKENKTTTRKTTKEVHMQHKIAPHDMERKLQQVTKFIEKGHICVIKMPLVLLDAVLGKLPQQAELMHPPQIEGNKALIRVHSK